MNRYLKTTNAMQLILTARFSFSSKSFSLFSGTERVFSLDFSRLGDTYKATEEESGRRDELALSEDEYIRAPELLKKRLASHGFLDGLPAPGTSRQAGGRIISHIGIKTSVPGSFFQKHHPVDTSFVAALKHAKPKAAPEVNMLTEAILVLKKTFPESSAFAISDTLFFSQLSKPARNYAVPENFSRRHDAYRFGGNGLALESILEKLKRMPGGMNSRTVVVYLDSTGSVTAINNDTPVDTSTGFSALEGLPGETNSGSIDPAVPLYLSAEKTWNADDAVYYLSRESGFLGAGESLITLDKSPNGAQMRNLLIHRVRKEIGGAVALLGGLDRIVLSGCILVSSPELRKRLLMQFEYLGVFLDDFANGRLSHEESRTISRAGSGVTVSVVPAEEDRVMTNALARLV